MTGDRRTEVICNGVWCAMGERRNRHIAVLVETDDSWGRGFVQGIADYGEVHGPWTLLIDPRDRQGRLRLPEGWSGDGVISRLSSRAMAEHVREAGVPAVDTDIIVPSQPWLGRVVTDDAARAALALGHLRHRGFQRFAWFAPPSRRYAWQRGRPFQAAVKAAGFDCTVYRPGYRPGHRVGWSEQQQLVGRWLDSLTKRVAVFTADARCGRRLAEICHSHGVAVPDEVAIIAGDTDELMCSLSTPPLSSIVLADRRQGQEAGALLNRLMEGRRVPRKSILIKPVGIVTRQSTDVLAIDDEEVVAAIRFIRTHAAGDIQVGDVLREVPVSRRSLELQFQKYLGISPAEEIRRVRLEKARHLLGRYEMPIAQVATASGFLNATRLGIAFRKRFGLTPRAYRKQSRPTLDDRLSRAKQPVSR